MIWFDSVLTVDSLFLHCPSQLVGTCERVLVQAHESLLHDEFQKLLDKVASEGESSGSSLYFLYIESTPKNQTVASRQLNEVAHIYSYLSSLISLPDLQRMYSILFRVPKGLEPLRNKFKEHVKREGESAIEKTVGTNDNVVSISNSFASGRKHRSIPFSSS